MDERGSALAAVLVLVVLLTVVGAAMVNSTLTEISIAYNQGDSIAAQYAAEAGLSRAIYELSKDAGWGQTPVTADIGDGQYEVSVVPSGWTRSITSTGRQGGARRVLKAALKTMSQVSASTVLANTTATVGSGTVGLTVINDFPASAASAVHANNRQAGPTALTINPTGTTITGGLTAGGTISGVTCASWAWTCNASASVRAIPELDLDSAATSSLKYRAQHTFDADGKYLYFKGGDTGRCNSGSPWTFTSTQQCWDYYVNSKSGTLGSGITNPVFFVEFTGATESTNYTPSGGGGGVAFRAARNDGWNTLSSNNGIRVPAGVVDGDVMLAAISWSDGSSETITTPTSYGLNMTNSDLTGGNDFTKELGDYTGDISLPVSVAPGPGEESYGYTKAGVPGTAGVTGDYWLSIYVTAGNSNIQLSTAVARVNSSGAQQQASSPSSEVPASSGQKTFTFAGLNLGTWSSGDRLRITYRFRHALGTTQSVTIGTPVAGWQNAIMVRTPWNAWNLVRRIDNGTSAGLAIYYKLASNEAGRVCVGSTSACYDWKFSPGSGSQSMTGAIVAYSGVDTTTPTTLCGGQCRGIDVENGQTTARSTSHSTPSITTTVANAMVVASFAVGATTATTNQWTPPAGMTERSDSGAQAVAVGVDEQLQATAGATGVKTATAAKSAVGATHILALKPSPGGGTAVKCGGIDYLETLCIRATAASPYPNSVLSQVTGAIVIFRCVTSAVCYGGSSDTTAGDIVFENMALDSTTTHNYTHTNVGSDPALIAAGKITMISSSPPTPGRTSTSITGIIYTFAGSDNPDGNGYLQGAGGNLGFDMQHGANGITLTLSGLLISNGSISLTNTGTGSAIIQYNRTVVESLPAAFTMSTTGSFMIPLSWSSGD